MEREFALVPDSPTLPAPKAAAIKALVRGTSSKSSEMTATKNPSLNELIETKTPQTSWWLKESNDGQPVQWPLLLAILPVVAVLSNPVMGSFLLLLPAMLPLLCLAPLVVLMSLPWWLHLPLTAKPLLIPLAVFFLPVIGFFAIGALALMPAMLVVLIPVFCLIPWVIAFTLPLLAVFSWLGVPLLCYAPVPSWLAVKWTWPLPDFTQLLLKARASKKELLSGRTA